MKLRNLDAPSVSEVLDILSAAASAQASRPTERVMASVADHSTTEGLALLGAYTSITDPTIRQALLDLAVMLGEPSD